MKWSNLQKSVSKFMPKKFYEMDPCFQQVYNENGRLSQLTLNGKSN